ncbi:protein YgfX [Faucicola boevrei]|uniref:protein YgfX n=1 Tax=Faucicola boevrei TaxID=346665 RepID=UPI000372C2CC|nr:protein YgfX [Moraxella boevrei]
MNNQGFIQIDSELLPSFYRKIVLISGMLTLLMIICLLPLTWAYRGILVVLLLVCSWFYQINQHHLVNISSLRLKNLQDFEKYDFLEWHLQLFQGYFVVPYGHQSDIYQAKLQQIHDMGQVLWLQFCVFEPFSKTLSVQIWQDQMDSDTWRQLKILANHEK